MYHEINITFKDNTEVKVMLPGKEFPQFFDDLNKGQFYIAKSTGAAFWAQMPNVRYITSRECTSEEAPQQR